MEQNLRMAQGEEMEKKKKGRIEIIDIAKGIAIFLVVWGHTATNEELLSADLSLLYRILYSVHMPLFFILSGMSMQLRPLKNREEWRYFLRKDILTIAFPYFIWALIYCTFNFDSVGWIFYGSWQTLGYAATVTSLWYLSCLFAARILTQAVLALTAGKAGRNTGKVLCFSGILFLIVSLLIPALPDGYPWCADVAFLATAFILWGAAAKRLLLELSVQKIGVLFAALFLSVALYAASVLLMGDQFTIMMMCNRSYGRSVFELTNALTGSFAVLVTAMLFRRFAEANLSEAAARPFLYIGQYTMGIFLLHKPFLQQVLIPGMEKLLGNALPEALIRLLAAFLAVLVSLVLCNLITYYVPELIGIFSKEKIRNGMPGRRNGE